MKALQTPCKNLELITSEQRLAVIILTAEVRRIEIEQHARPVIAVDEGQPVQVLDDDAREALVDIFQKRREAGQVEPSCLVPAFDGSDP
ncbi:hypothetical protein RvVAT039_04940 [Agrobacterium vitis]|nr:hypothetical protein RvVAT039_04940 [Agrobacterium vitis]